MIKSRMPELRVGFNRFLWQSQKRGKAFSMQNVREDVRRHGRDGHVAPQDAGRQAVADGESDG